MSSNKEKILVAMSGGVDSATVALQLKQKGFDVTGCTLQMHDFAEKNIQDVKQICDFLNIELKIVDVSKSFTSIVKQNFYDEYLKGRTPNPCVLCNKELKWKSLIEVADQLNIEKIATGHYAQIKYDVSTKNFSIFKSVDAQRDQTYMLWKLPQNFLSRTIFPLGEISSKEYVRNLARTNELPSSDKTDSQDICFIPDNDYRLFIKNFYLKNNSITENDLDDFDEWKGDIILNGEKIGEHKGYPFYTVGQRRGLGIAYKTPLYVKKIDAKNKIIEVAELENTFFDGIIGTEVNLMKNIDLRKAKVFWVKVRYKDSGRFAECRIENDQLVVHFEKSVSSVALGQSIVLYSDDELIGGSIINETF